MMGPRDNGQTPFLLWSSALPASSCLFGPEIRSDWIDTPRRKPVQQGLGETGRGTGGGRRQRGDREGPKEATA